MPNPSSFSGFSSFCSIVVRFWSHPRSTLPKNPMATSVEVQQRQSYARALLERNISNAAVATMVSARYHVSRSTAYLDIAAAHGEIDASDDGPDAAELEEHAPASTLAQLQHLFDTAVATGDVKGAASLVAAMDKVKRWSGPLQTQASPWA